MGMHTGRRYSAPEGCQQQGRGERPGEEAGAPGGLAVVLRVELAARHHRRGQQQLPLLPQQALQLPLQLAWSISFAEFQNRWGIAAAAD